MYYSSTIYHDNIFDPIEEKKLCYRNSCCSYSIDYHFYFFFFLSSDFERIDKSCKTNYCSSVLIIVKYGDIKLSLESLLDFKTSRSRDIFEINSSKYRSNILDSFDNFFGVLCIKHDRKCIESCKLLKESTFSFHHGKSCFRSNVSKPKYCRAIRNNSNGICFERVVINF